MAATLIRTVIVYILVVIGIRLMGKRQIGELQPGELVITILISECAAFPIQDLNRPLINGIISIFTLIVLEILLSVATERWPFLRKSVEGRPVVIISDGKIDQRAMKKLRLSVDDLVNNLRQQGYFDLGDVAFAVVETNGKLSVLPTARMQPATAGMVSEITDKTAMSCIVIDNGIVRDGSLELIDMSEKELADILKKRKTAVKEVFLMTADRQRNIYIAKKEKK